MRIRVQVWVTLLLAPLWGAGAMGLPLECSSEGGVRKVLSPLAPQGQLPWHQKINFQEVEKTFREGKIVSIRTLQEAESEIGKTVAGSHPVYRVRFENGVEAIFKPNYNGSAGAEVDAYQLSQLIHSKQVPPTGRFEFTESRVASSVLESPHWEALKGLEGSVQYYVPSPYDLVKMDERSKVALRNALPKERSDQKIFQFVFGQWDAHPGNQILDESGHLALIDNTAIKDPVKTRYGESPFRLNMRVKASARTSIQNEPKTFPFSRAVILDHPTKENFAEFMKDHLDAEQIDRYWVWRERSKSKDTSMAVVFWRNEVWIQGIGFQNYGTRAEVFSRETLENYRKLNFETLRNRVSKGISDEQIEDYLERRDQVLKAAENGPSIP